MMKLRSTKLQKHPFHRLHTFTYTFSTLDLCSVVYNEVICIYTPLPCPYRILHLSTSKSEAASNMIVHLCLKRPSGTHMLNTLLQNKALWGIVLKECLTLHAFLLPVLPTQLFTAKQYCICKYCRIFSVLQTMSDSDVLAFLMVSMMESSKQIFHTWAT